MKIISFAWTTAAFRARRKTVTRRDWNDRYAATFRAGEIVQAYDRQPRFGGKKIGTILLTQKPYKESESEMPNEDYEGEGFAFLDEHPEFKPKGWKDFNLRWKFEEDRAQGSLVYVVRFKILDIVNPILNAEASHLKGA